MSINIQAFIGQICAVPAILLQACSYATSARQDFLTARRFLAYFAWHSCTPGVISLEKLSYARSRAFVRDFKTTQSLIENIQLYISTFTQIFFSSTDDRKIGFYGVFTLSIMFYIVAFFYGTFRLKESPALPDQPTKDTKKQKSFLADFFDLAHIKDTFRVAFKHGARDRRIKVIMLMVVVMIVIGPYHGTFSSSFSLGISFESLIII